MESSNASKFGDFKELETADFDNPKWNTWKAPTLHGSGHETSITFNMTDNETGGECSVRHYNISCTEEGREDKKEKMFNPNEKILMEDLLPETTYNCTGRIVHSIPGLGDLDTLETPMADFIVVETAVALEPETTLAPKPDPELETPVVTKDNEAGNSEGQKADPVTHANTEPDADGVVAGVVIAIIIIIVLLVIGFWWKYKKNNGPKDQPNGIVSFHNHSQIVVR